MTVREYKKLCKIWEDTYNDIPKEELDRIINAFCHIKLSSPIYDKEYEAIWTKTERSDAK